MSDLNDEIDGSTTDIGAGPRKRLLRLNDVLAIFPISRSGWYAGVKSGKYPARVRIGVRIVAWWEHEVLAVAEACRPSKLQTQ